MPMTPSDLLAHLRSIGFTITLATGKNAGQLLVDPGSKLTPEQIAAIKEHKPAILTLLAEEAEAERIEQDEQAKREAIDKCWGDSDPFANGENMAMRETMLFALPDDWGGGYHAMPAEVWKALEEWCAAARKQRQQEREKAEQRAKKKRRSQ